ncbi:MAG: PHD finger domain-containing protein [Candidatus Odinarchaeota archaeon]
MHIDISIFSRLKEDIWNFFDEEINIKPVLFKSMACYAYIISNKCISDRDVEEKTGISHKSARKLLSFLESRGLLFLQYDEKKCPLKEKQLVYFNPVVISSSRFLDLQWEELLVFSALKLLHSVFDVSDFQKLTELLQVKCPSPEKWIRSLLEKQLIQGEFSDEGTSFQLSGYSYPAMFKQRFFSSYFPVIEGIVNLYGPEIAIEKLKRLLELETAELISLLAEISIVDYLGVSIDFNTRETVWFRFEAITTRKIPYDSLTNLDDDGIYFKILIELLLAGKKTLDELASHFGIKRAEMERMLLLLSSKAGKDSLLLQGPEDDPTVEFRYVGEPSIGDLFDIDYELISVFLILFSAGRSITPLDAFPFHPERLMKILTKFSLVFHNRIQNEDGVKVEKLPNIEEREKQLFLSNVLKGHKKLAERTKSGSKNPLDISREGLKDMVQYFHKSIHSDIEGLMPRDDNLIDDSQPPDRLAIERGLNEFDKVFLGVMSLFRVFDPKTAASLLFLDKRLILMEFLSLYARGFFKIFINQDNEVVITNLSLTSSKSMDLTRDRLNVLENLFSSGNSFIITESDILSKQYSIWDLGYFSYHGVIKGRFAKNNLTISEVLFDPLLTSITCFNCGVSVSVLDSFCDACGSSIVQCPICKRYIAFGDKILLCTSCRTVFHAEHIKEYLKMRDSCPSCGQKDPEMSPWL